MRRGLIRLRQANLGGHQPFRPRPVAHQDLIAGLQLGNAEAPQRLHVNEHVRLIVALAGEAEAAQPVEPLDRQKLEPAGRDTCTCVRAGAASAG